jgi:hypothetical protein
MKKIPLIDFEKEIENHFGKIDGKLDITGFEIENYLQKKYNNNIKSLHYNKEDRELVIIFKK